MWPEKACRGNYSDFVRRTTHTHRHTVTPYHDTGRVSTGVGGLINSEQLRVENTTNGHGTGRAAGHLRTIPQHLAPRTQHLLSPPSLTNKNACTTLHMGDLPPNDATARKIAKCYEMLHIQKVPGWTPAPGLPAGPTPTATQLYNNEENATKCNRMQQIFKKFGLSRRSKPPLPKRRSLISSLCVLCDLRGETPSPIQLYNNEENATECPKMPHFSGKIPRPRYRGSGRRNSISASRSTSTRRCVIIVPSYFLAPN